MATQAGLKINDPEELKTLTESDIARVGGDIYRRDLAKEQSAMERYEGERGTKELDEAFNASVYGIQEKTTPIAPAPLAPTPTPIAPAPIAPAPAPTPAPVSPTAQQATLYDPKTGSAKVVTVGSAEASNLQTQGWSLNKPAIQPVDPSGFAPPAGYEEISHPSLINQYSAHIVSPDGKTMYGIKGDGTQVVEPAPGITGETAELLGATGASLSEFDTVVGRTSIVTDEILQGVYDELGIPELANSAFASPSISTVETYNTAYKDSNLGELKIRIDEKLTELTNKKTLLNEKLEKLGDNPWLSEASLRGRTKRATDIAQGDMDIINDEIANLSALYNSGTKEIEDLVTRTTTDFQTNATLNTAKLNYLVKQAEVKLGIKQDEGIAKAYEQLPDYLKAVADQSPTGAYGHFGSVTTGDFIYNKNTGEFEQVRAPSAGGGTADPKKTTTQILSEQAGEMTNLLTSVQGEDGFVSPADYNTAKRSWVGKTGKDGADFDKRFSSFRNPQNFDYNLD